MNQIDIVKVLGVCSLVGSLACNAISGWVSNKKMQEAIKNEVEEQIKNLNK